MCYTLIESNVNFIEKGLKMENQIDWSKASLQDYKLAKKIVKRASDEMNSRGVGIGLDEFSLQMDIIATHINGCKLKLKELLAADTGNFLHDVCGIIRHLDRTTGKLIDCFVPRYAG